MSLADLLRDLAESLKPPEEKPRTHGCYYVVEGQPPERCVLEYGRPQDCVFAAQLVGQGKDQTSCQYWRPLQAPPQRSVKQPKPSHSEDEQRKLERRAAEEVKEAERAAKARQASEAVISGQTILAVIQDRNALVQALITKELLDKPLALRRQRR